MSDCEYIVVPKFQFAPSVSPDEVAIVTATVQRLEVLPEDRRLTVLEADRSMTVAYENRRIEVPADATR